MNVIGNNNRYLRQILVPGFGREGQNKVGRSKVLVIGVGGLGSPIVYYLTSLGVGTLGIVDYDIVASTNLNRQILFLEQDIGKYKVEQAQIRLHMLNSQVNIQSYNLRADYESLYKIVPDYDIVVCALDNLETRYTVNKICVAMNKLLVDGSVQGFYGYILSVIPGKTPCYNCCFPEHKNEDQQKKNLIRLS